MTLSTKEKPTDESSLGSLNIPGQCLSPDSSHHSTAFSPRGQRATTPHHHSETHKCFPQCLSTSEAHTQTKAHLETKIKAIRFSRCSTGCSSCNGTLIRNCNKKDKMLVQYSRNRAKQPLILLSQRKTAH